MGTEQLNVRLPADLAAEFGRQAKLHGETKAAVVVALLRGWVEARQRQATRDEERRIRERAT